MSDEVIKEVRRVRHEISQQCDHDIHKVASYYRAFQEELRRSGRFRVVKRNRSRSGTPESAKVEERAAL